MSEMTGSLEEITEKVRSCEKCELYRERNKAVPGEGSEKADIMFIGEAPGRQEDKQGRPFVGRAGEVLDRLLESIGLDRDDVFIANILKCRPSNNRDPKDKEIRKCTPYLDSQIEIINPRIISTLGKFATSYILDKYGFEKKPISSAHGKVFKIQNLQGVLKIVPQYHPAAACYNPRLEETLLEDFKVLEEELE